MSRFLSSVFLLVLLVALPAQVDAGAKTPSPAASAMADGEAAVQAGKFDAGIAAFRKATELAPKDGRGWHMLGYCLHAAGRLDEALQVHLKAAGFPDVAPMAIYNVACVHSLKGDKDQAIAWLQKAIANGFNDAGQLAGDSDFDGLRADPRFQALAAQLASGITVYAPITPRRSARVAYFRGKGSPGQLAIDYAVLEWQDKFDAALTSPKFQGKKWRFGGEFWTTLDNSMPLRFGTVTVPPGYWYLTLEQRGERQFVLGVHDPATVRKQHLDPYRADQLQGGIEVPLQYRAAATAHPQLEIAVSLPPGELEHGQFAVGFGGHELSADVVVGVEAEAKPAK